MEIHVPEDEVAAAGITVADEFEADALLEARERVGPLSGRGGLIEELEDAFPAGQRPGHLGVGAGDVLERRVEREIGP